MFEATKFNGLFETSRGLVHVEVEGGMLGVAVENAEPVTLTLGQSNSMPLAWGQIDLYVPGTQNWIAKIRVDEKARQLRGEGILIIRDGIPAFGTGCFSEGIREPEVQR